MNLTDNEVLKFQKGSPVFLEDVCAIYPATLGEIVDLGYNKFQQYLSILTATKPTNKNEDKELNELIDQLTDFQFILFMTSIDVKTNQEFKSGFMFFTHEEATITLDPPQIFIGPLEDERIITETQFYDFQQILRRMYFLEMEGEEIIISDDDDPATKAIKMKMRANREKVRKAKAAKAAREKTDMKMSDLIGSMALNDCGLNIHNGSQ